MQKKKVFVGLSGGVDSAVSAALLLREGYEVTGAFIKIWQPEFTECTWEQDRLDAMRVAAFLGIPFREVDLSDEYKDEVIAHMKEGYARGTTPNPDVLCNRTIKFGAFREWAHESGADMVATGHHARIEKENGKFRLFRGADKGKDQSYFLHQLTQDDLAHSLFPIGHLTKKEVREKAEALRLPVAKRPDSQGLCFVGPVSMHDFLQELLKTTKGDVKNSGGEVIGEHDGAALYTIGQRHGFTVSAAGAEKAPHYVIAVNTNENEIIVSPDVRDAHRKEVPIRTVSFTSGKDIDLTRTYGAQTRYRQQPIPCTLKKGRDGQLLVRFPEGVLAAPGQSLVLYQGDECLGGGAIC